MNDKTLELLTRLADKFGTTVDHLWAVLVKQAIISAATDAIIAATLIALWIWAFRFVLNKTTTPPETPADEYPRAEWREEGALLGWTVVFFAIVPVLVQAFRATTALTTALLNPEYWALKQLLP